jgi:hypothetical protein
MSRPLAAPHFAALFALAVGAAVAACDNPFALPPATAPAIDKTFTLYSLTGSDVSAPSAYDMVYDTTVRTDRTYQFDFALDMPDSLGDSIPMLIPPGGLGLSPDGGLQITTTPFDSLTFAPNSGYDQTARQLLKLGTVVLASSRTQSCNYNIAYPLYAKLQVLGIDPVARSVTFHMVLDPNCGYRSLVADSALPSN